MVPGELSVTATDAGRRRGVVGLEKIRAWGWQLLSLNGTYYVKGMHTHIVVGSKTLNLEKHTN